MTAHPRPDADPPPPPAPRPAGSAAPPWPPGDPPPAAGARLRLSSPGDLVAALPVLIGFHPEDSLVLVGLAGPELRGRVGLTVRVDLPSGRDVRRVCTDAVSVLAGSGPDRAVAVVVRGRPSAAPRRARRDVALAVRRELRRAGIGPTAVLWASGTRAEDRWSCYPLPGQACGCSGTVPDPTATPVAVAAAVQGGRAVLPDRAAVRAQLDGDATDSARRARLGSAPVLVGRPGRPDPWLLDGCLDDAAEGRLVVDDRLALGVAAALADPDFRDEALRRCLGAQAPHAEQLWAALTRALPAPERADAAALLATCALLRGDGALATLAVERALEDRPAHILATVVDTSLRGAVTPGVTPGPYAGPVGLRRLLTAATGAPAEGDG
ncbi:hypothetical protein Ae168Ps1_5798c [Pseudonocardia sp. Ae168_Ps1]|uniref:DUF4192 domain-containing protein n=1 Tax=unclassified Pseudonocardia TaxID=2619320 RepID=UPI00094B37FD|nr:MULTISPECIES: DUF4192 domain-containing protein [unclassified Pseudonocardia]OLL71295.1 hypothetical protein Ae168Ps1_5798c [Pseudonocardia sp. Ae168_Ps1]OLL77154.1 hypothetical protein Ae150APs1_5532 [Pseudonocardia sp. Ae150A_Ps1]OLL88738.1 hypothetical protein Ae263Ps1_5793c [Pseudonocardia sp. Ae263_Ps1]OLL91242.1 hypothetical protein Ae356Ps1_1139 [Pseudonocardia sp. Ae356_Ps1]